MRKLPAVSVLIVLFGLVPIAAWLVMALNLDPGGLGRQIGLALLLLVLSPLAVCGLLMIGGVGLLRRVPRAGRIVATVGAGLVLAAGVAFAVGMLWRLDRCGGIDSHCTYLGAASLLYAAAHAGLIAALWRAPADVARA